MLYQTHHHPFFFHFKPFASINNNLLLLLLPSPSSATTATTTATTTTTIISSETSQVEKEMESVEGALKESFRKEMALKSNQQQVILEDFCAGNVQNGGGGGVSVVEDFSVDDLLDFSKMGGADDDDEEEEAEEGDDDGGFQLRERVVKEEEEEGEETEEEKMGFSLKQEQRPEMAEMEKESNFSLKDDFGSSELSVPTDDVADLEWLSHFVDDSFSEFSLTYPAGNLPKCPPENPSEPPKAAAAAPCFVAPVLAKAARSKRTRSGGRGWSLGSTSLTTTEYSSSSSSSSSTSSSSFSTPWLIYNTLSPNFDSFNSVAIKPPAKKPKKNPFSSESTAEGGGTTTQLPRRCSHCGVQKTPQWRTGPLGAKTLCNACGVRFKSGRLLPEYRPACSPTFSIERHSNHHRKVLEMRKKKEVGCPESGFAPAVPSFG